VEVFQPRPSDVMVPVELFSITTSADAASRRTKSTPSGDFRLTPKLRLERLDEANEGLVRFEPIRRMKSDTGRFRF